MCLVSYSTCGKRHFRFNQWVFTPCFSLHTISMEKKTHWCWTSLGAYIFVMGRERSLIALFYNNLLWSNTLQVYLMPCSSEAFFLRCPPVRSVCLAEVWENFHFCIWAILAQRWLPCSSYSALCICAEEVNRYFCSLQHAWKSQPGPEAPPMPVLKDDWTGWQLLTSNGAVGSRWFRLTL